MVRSSARRPLSCSELYRDPRFFHGIALFNKGDWYSSHDVFESLWGDASDSEKLLLQGFLQIAVGNFHIERNNLNGAIITLSSGLMNLESFRFNVLGIDINYLCVITANYLDTIQKGQDLHNSELKRSFIQIDTG